MNRHFHPGTERHRGVISPFVIKYGCPGEAAAKLLSVDGDGTCADLALLLLRKSKL